MAREGRGSIVNVSSVYGLLSPVQDLYAFRRERGETFVKPVAYSVSKSAVLNLTRYLATYWAKDGVRVNTLTLVRRLERPAAGVPRRVRGTIADGAHAGRARGARRRRLPRLRRVVVRHRLERRRRRRLVGVVVADGRSEPHRREGGSAALRRVARQAPARGRDASLPGRTIEARRTSSDAVAAARAAQPAWAERTAVARGDVVRELALLLRERRGRGVRDRGRGDGEAARARSRRDRRGGRDGALHRRRGPTLVRPDDDGEHGAPHGAHGAAAARRRRADHELQHAAAERRLEGVSRRSSAGTRPS